MIDSYVDLILILIVLFSVLRGLQVGAIYGLLDLAAWIGSLIAAFRLYELVARWLGNLAPWADVWDRPAAFIIISLVAGLAIRLLGNLLIARLPKQTHVRPTNRLLGIIPGFINGLITAAIIGALLLSLPLPGGLREATRNSALANRLAVVAQHGEAALQPVFGDAINQTLNTLTIRPDSDERIELPFTKNDATPTPDLEAEMLVLINDERSKVGLAPLAADPELREVARRHSNDMLMRGYFAHDTPEGLSAFDRINAAGVSYYTAGENLALAPTLTIAHQGLMNSPGHRENILRPEFGRVGIGILDAGVQGLMITQNFRD